MCIDYIIYTTHCAD